MNKNVHAVSPSAMQVLRGYNWPGNVRELQNVNRQAILKTNEPVLLAGCLPKHLVDDAEIQAKWQARKFESTTLANACPNHHELNGSLDQLIDERLEGNSPNLYDDLMSHVENRLVSQALKKASGDKAEAARLLGIKGDSSKLKNNATVALFGLAPAKNDSANQFVIRPGMKMTDIEKAAIRGALGRTGGCRKEAANLLGMSTRTMQRRVKEYDLD